MWCSRFWTGLLVAKLLVLASSAPVEAELRFSPERLPNGTPYILVSGRFDPTDDLIAFANMAASHKPQMVVFDSPGGTIVTALKLGRIIRLLGLTTFQTRPYQCDSACAFAFVGGVRRLATAGSIGVHRSSLRQDGDRDLSFEGELLQHITGDLLSYLREMNISAEFLELALKTSSSDMRHLTLGEMQRMNVVTLSSPASPPPRQVPILPDQTPTAPPPNISANDPHSCDRLAANPNDRRKHPSVAGIDYDTLLKHREEAARQCELAIAQFPREWRFYYQKARAIELSDPNEAAAIYSRLITRKYLAAYDNLGWMYLTGRVRGKKNKEAALKLFRQGAKLGDADSMHSLGKMLWTDNPQEAMQWLERASALGHTEAKKDIQKLQEQQRLATPNFENRNN